MSAGNGPLMFNPSFLSRLRAGEINLVSSCPKRPFSPACGFKPETKILGSLILNNSINDWCESLIVSLINESVIVVIASFNET